MKNLLLIFALVIAISSCKDDEEPIKNTVVSLTEQEKSDLQFLREEEKLARDVYIYSYNKYNESTFSNISSSEQRHMDEVLTLLVKYNLTDPVSTNAAGVFDNADLQKLYDDLTKTSDSSLVHAYTVGAMIEDLDIHDIEGFEERTDKADILAVYQKLACGSRNHMRAFSGKLNDEGEPYTARFLSQEALDAILAGSHENCGG